MTDPAGHSFIRRDRLSKDFISVGVDDTVGEALDKIRAASGAGDIFYLYACDPEGRLAGVVPIRKLIRAQASDRVASLMFGRVVKLPLDAPDDLVQDFFVTYRFLAFPVVDADGRIAGTLEVKDFLEQKSDALFDDVEGRVRDEVFRFLGVPRNELAERKVFKMAGRRMPWLLVNIGGGFLAATTTRLFEHSVERVLVAAAFIPMVLVLSESLGVQTTAVSATMVAEGTTDQSAIRREIVATGIAGLFAAFVVALLGRIYYPGFSLPLALFLAIGVSTLFASSFGAMLPFAFRRFKVDPHLASAPLVLAASDNVTLLIYFTLVSLLVQ